MLTNQEINLLIKMENLIGYNEKKLFKNGKFEFDYVAYHKGGGETQEHEVITNEDFVDFINLVEDQLNAKRVASERSNAYNKAHPEKHRKTNRDYTKRKSQFTIDK